MRLAKSFYGWPPDAQFLVPDGVYERFSDGMGQRGAALSKAWHEAFSRYRREQSEQAGQIELQLARDLPQGWDADLPYFAANEKGVATREASGKVLNAIAKRVPWLLGGAGDLAPAGTAWPRRPPTTTASPRCCCAAASLTAHACWRRARST